jgi:hypothetical protein
MRRLTLHTGAAFDTFLDSRARRRLVLDLGRVRAGHIRCAVVAAFLLKTINTFTNGLQPRV